MGDDVDRDVTEPVGILTSSGVSALRKLARLSSSVGALNNVRAPCGDGVTLGIFSSWLAVPKVETCPNDELNCDDPVLEMVVTQTLASRGGIVFDDAVWHVRCLLWSLDLSCPDDPVVPQISISSGCTDYVPQTTVLLL